MSTISRLSDRRSDGPSPSPEGMTFENLDAQTSWVLWDALLNLRGRRARVTIELLDEPVAATQPLAA